MRPAMAADEVFLREMLYEALFVPPGADPFPASIVEDPKLAVMVDGFGGPDDVGVVADLQGGPAIGAAWVRLLIGEDRGYGWVDDDTPELSIAVVPGHRGRGIGTLLLTELVAAAGRRYGAISLSVDVRNPALRLYERLGWVPVRDEGDSRTMVRRLEPEPR